MLKIPKKQSYNFKNLFSLPEKSNPVKVFLSLVLVFVFYIALPVYVVIYSKRLPFVMLPFFYLVNILAVNFLISRYFKRKYRIRLRIQDYQEKINILNDQNLQEVRNNLSFEERIKDYSSLKMIIEKINQNLSLDYITDNLTDIAFSLLARCKGTCLLYLVDSQTQKLSLFKTKKEDPDLIIKTKEGDVFDHWVLRHATPLLVEDVKNDFRFDQEKLKKQDIRPITSLVSAAFINEYSFLGLLRLDNPIGNFYTQSDLRLLAAISDIGTVAVENGQLFQKMQDLAIHDGLTLLYTKGYFLERLEEECRRNIRKDRPISLLMLDIDCFKNYNDKFGHIAGDIVLKNLSLIIQQSVKEYDSVTSRFGGEEFCVVLLNKNMKDALKIAENLRKKIENTKIILRRKETNITVSIGLATLPENAANEDELIHFADRALYEAKQKGRNKVVEFTRPAI